MRRTTALLGAALALATVLAGGPAVAAPAVELHGPPVTAEECWDGGGGVAVDRFTRVEFCSGGEFDGRVVIG
jgi:hypothetical protein